MSDAEVWILEHYYGGYDECTRDLVSVHSTRDGATAAGLALVKSHTGIEWSREDDDEYTHWDGRVPGKRRSPGSGYSDGGRAYQVYRQELLS